MSDELSQEELGAIAEEVKQAITAKVAEAISEIGEEKLSQALGGGLTTWKLALEICNPYVAQFKKMSDQFKIGRDDVYKSQIVHNCLYDCVSNLQLAQTLMQTTEGAFGGAFGGLFGGGGTSQSTLSDHQSYMKQCFFRIVEAETHLKSGLNLYSEKLKAKQKEAEKEE